MGLPWYAVSLLAHLGGLAIVVGGGACDALVNALFWRELKVSPSRAAALANLMGLLGTVVSAGGVLALASGVSLLVAMNFVHWGALWLSIKLALFCVLTVNGMWVAAPKKRQVVELTSRWVERAQMRPPQLGSDEERELAEIERELGRLRSRLTWFHVTENAGFLLVLVLAVFRFR